MNDIRLALRSLRATPVVSAVAILSLALGIGANSAIFSLVNSLLLRSLPVRQPGELGLLFSAREAVFSSTASSWTYPIWDELRRRPQPFAGLAAWSSAWLNTRFNLAASGESQLVDGIWVSGTFFETLGVPAILGRVFSEADDRRGGGESGAVAVIGYGFWQRQFGGAADVVGRTLTVDRVSVTIVGVTPPEFLGAEIGRAFDVALPLGCEPLLRGKDSALDDRSEMWWLSVIARLRPGQSFAEANAALRSVQEQVREATIPGSWRKQDQDRYLKDAFVLRPAATGSSSLRGRYERPLWTLLAVVGLVLLIACANIANLLLARATARRHELSVRLALGASRWRVFRQVAVESLALSALGAALGLLFARWGSLLLVTQLQTTTNRVVLHLGLDWRVVSFNALVACSTAMLFGTLPALRAARVPPIESLKTGGRGCLGDARGSLATSLVVAQVALSLMLVVAAFLFVRTFVSLLDLRLGFEQDKVLIVNIDATKSRVDPADRAAVFERVRQAVLAVPGVERAAVSNRTPVSGSFWATPVHVVGAEQLPEKESLTYMNALSPGWFATFGTPLLAGRDIHEHDVAGSLRIAIVNQAFVRKFLNGANPIGRVVRQLLSKDPESPGWEIVGLVADAVYASQRQPVPPTLYRAIAQHDGSSYPLTTASLNVRAASAPAGLRRSLAQAIVELDPDLSLTFRPLADQVSAALVQDRLVALISGCFGGLALLLAGLGLYGVTSYAVTRRRTEIGIRMALGAAPGRVVRLVLGRVATLVGAGVVIGGLASLWTGRFVAAMLFGVPARDPATLAAAVVVLCIVGDLAAWLPARRAARIDPAEVLREG